MSKLIYYNGVAETDEFEDSESKFECERVANMVHMASSMLYVCEFDSIRCILGLIENRRGLG